MDPPFRCSACKTVQYCSEACQRADWCRHDKECDQLRDNGFEETIEMIKKKLIEGMDHLDGQLYQASWLGRDGAVERLLNLGADVNWVCAYGFTPLHVAAQMGFLRVVTRLVAAGAVVDAVTTDHSLWTPLLIAAIRGHAAVVTVLLDAGASIHSKNEDGLSALVLATILKNLPVMALLTAKAEAEKEAAAAAQRVADELVAGEGREQAAQRARGAAGGEGSGGKGKSKGK
jgi:ankyrin repeat protein